MVWASLVALFLAQSSVGVVADDFPGEIVGHSLAGKTGSVSTLLLENVEHHKNGAFTAWIETDHSRDKTVQHRRSWARVYFDCRGSYRTNAATHYDAAGVNIYNWDGYGQSIAVRPGTVYAEFQRRICN